MRDMPHKMMYVVIQRVISKPCCLNRFATPEVVICTENVVIHDFGVGMLFIGERLQFPPEYIVQHNSVCLLLSIQPLQRKIIVRDWHRQESDH